MSIFTKVSSHIKSFGVKVKTGHGLSNSINVEHQTFPILNGTVGDISKSHLSAFYYKSSIFPMGNKK